MIRKNSLFCKIIRIKKNPFNFFMILCCLIHGKMRPALGAVPGETVSPSALTGAPWPTSRMERQSMRKSVSRGCAVQAAAIPMPSSLMSSSPTLYTAFSSSCGFRQNISFICILWNSSAPALASPYPCCTAFGTSSCHRSRNGSACLFPQKHLHFRS